MALRDPPKDGCEGDQIIIEIYRYHLRSKALSLSATSPRLACFATTVANISTVTLGYLAIIAEIKALEGQP